MAKLYQRKNSSCWYFKYTVNGKRYQRSTGETNLDKAERVMLRFLGRLDNPDALCTLEEEIFKYTDAKTNPKYLYCQKEGISFSVNSVRYYMAISNQTLKTLAKHCPFLLKKELDAVTRGDAVLVRDVIAEDRGRTSMGKAIFTFLKVMFSFLVSTGKLQVSPFASLAPIRCQTNEKIALAPEQIKIITNNKDGLFENQAEFAYFVVLAFTGMRKEEALAFNINKLNDVSYTVDTQTCVSLDRKKSFKAPKREVTRVIPLSDIVMDVIKTLKPDKQGFLFLNRIKSPCAIFKALQKRLFKICPEYSDVWAKLTPHVLRHSLNTNLLLIAEQPPLLVAEYLSWNHQKLISVQSRYTHIYAKNLLSIAGAIDEMYTDRKQALIANKLFI